MNEGQNDHINVKKVHAQHPKGNCHEKLRAAFRKLEKEVKKGHEESPDDKKRVEDVPGFNVPEQKPFGFFRDVRVPDQHILSKADIAPEDGEGEQELPHDVIVLLVHKAQVTGVLQRVDDDDYQGHSSACSPGKDINAPHLDRPPGIAVAILTNGGATKILSCEAEEPKVENGSQPKKRNHDGTEMKPEICELLSQMR